MTYTDKAKKWLENKCVNCFERMYVENFAKLLDSEVTPKPEKLEELKPVRDYRLVIQWVRNNVEFTEDGVNKLNAAIHAINQMK